MGLCIISWFFLVNKYMSFGFLFWLILHAYQQLHFHTSRIFTIFHHILLCNMPKDAYKISWRGKIYIKCRYLPWKCGPISTKYPYAAKSHVVTSICNHISTVSTLFPQCLQFFFTHHGGCFDSIESTGNSWFVT